MWPFVSYTIADNGLVPQSFYEELADLVVVLWAHIATQNVQVAVQDAQIAELDPQLGAELAEVLESTDHRRVGQTGTEIGAHEVRRNRVARPGDARPFSRFPPQTRSAATNRSTGGRASSHIKENLLPAVVLLLLIPASDGSKHHVTHMCATSGVHIAIGCSGAVRGR